MIISHRNCLSAVKPVRPVRPVTCVTAVLSVTCCLQLVTYPPFEKHSHPWRFNHDRCQVFRSNGELLFHLPYIQSYVFEVVGWVRQSARAQHMLEMPKKHWIALILYDSIEDMLPIFNVWYACAPNWLRVKVVHYWRRTHLKYPNLFGFKRRTGTKMHIFLQTWK